MAADDSRIASSNQLAANTGNARGTSHDTAAPVPTQRRARSTEAHVSRPPYAWAQLHPAFRHCYSLRVLGHPDHHRLWILRMPEFELGIPRVGSRFLPAPPRRGRPAERRQRTEMRSPAFNPPKNKTTKKQPKTHTPKNTTNTHTRGGSTVGELLAYPSCFSSGESGRRTRGTRSPIETEPSSNRRNPSRRFGLRLVCQSRLTSSRSLG